GWVEVRGPPKHMKSGKIGGPRTSTHPRAARTWRLAMSAATAKLHACQKPAPPKAAPRLHAPESLLQRKCACGGTLGLDGECDECRKKKLGVQRRAVSSGGPAVAPPIVHEVLRSPGQPLDAAARAFMQPRSSVQRLTGRT